jgi:hypothetical protein
MKRILIKLSLSQVSAEELMKSIQYINQNHFKQNFLKHIALELESSSQTNMVLN